MPDLRMRLKVTQEGLERGLREGWVKVKTWSSRVKQQLSATFSKLKMAVGAGVAAGLAIATRSAIKFAAEMEQTRIALRTMMGDVQLADKMLADAFDFSRRTPFEPTEIIDAMRKLIAFGVPTKEVMNLIRQLGDVSAGTGKDLNELAVIFGKAFTKGKVDLEILNQFTEAGIPIMRELMKVTDQYGESFFRFVSAGKLGIDELMAALKELTGEGGQFGGMMEEQSKTLGGVWSTLTGNIKDLLRLLGEGYLPMLKDLVSTTNLLVSANQEWIASKKIIEQGGVEIKYKSSGSGMIDAMQSGGGDMESLYMPGPTGEDVQRDRASRQRQASEAAARAALEHAQAIEKMADAEREYNMEVNKAEVATIKAREKEIEAAERLAKKEEDLAQRRQKAVSDTIDSLALANQESALQLEGKEKELAILRAINRAQAAAGDVPLTPEQVFAVTSLAETGFDLAQARKAQQQSAVATDDIFANARTRIGGSGGRRIQDAMMLDEQRNAALNEINGGIKQLVEQTRDDGGVSRWP